VIRYAITDGRSSGSSEDTLAAARRWSADGIDFVQLREKHREPADLVLLATAMQQIFSAAGSGTRLLINGRPDIALAAQADGVHLTSNPGELTPEQGRQVFTHVGLSVPIVSVSCHTLDEVRRAHAAGVDLILFGPVFEKRALGELVAEGSGLDALRSACEAAAKTPVLALGGVTAKNAANCVDAGAAGIAAIRLFA
jgi:thiamine-phosphate pyrophosphorylase